MIRVPVIVPNSNWSTQTSAKNAEIVSPIYVQPKPGKVTITGTVLPTDGQTVIFSTPFAQTYTFRNTPTLAYDVQIAASIVTSVENLISKISENETTVNAWVEGSNGIVEHKVAGDGNNVATPTGTWAGVTYTTYSGNNGAYDYRAQEYSFSQNGGIAQTIILPAYTTIDNAQDIADDLAALTTSTAVTVPSIAIATANAARIIVRSDTADAQQTLEVTSFVVGTDPNAAQLFTTGDFSVGATIGHPVSDVAGDDKVIRMYHPADPVFFRNDNRPLIDLADNDKQIHKAFIALKDGYDIDTGTTYASGSPNTTITAPNGLTITGPLYLRGGLFFNGAGAVQMNVTNLNVSDRVITANSGEAGAGVDGGSGVEAGLSIDRGLWNDTGLLWYEKSSGGTASSDTNAVTTDVTNPYSGGHWQIDGPIIGTAYNGKALIVGRTDGTTAKYGTVIEYEQITIGDGATTFGTFNASGGVIDTALNNALAALPNGGKIFIKRGNYTVSSDIVVAADNITIEGEGSASKLTFGNTFRIRVGTTATAAVDNTMLHKLRLANANAANATPLVQLLYGANITVGPLVTGVSYRIVSLLGADNFSNVGATNTVGEIFTATGTTPTTWASASVLTPVYSRGCIVEKCWFDGVSGSITNLDVDFNEYHGHMLSNNISTTYYTNLP